MRLPRRLYMSNAADSNPGTGWHEGPPPTADEIAGLVAKIQAVQERLSEENNGIHRGLHAKMRVGIANAKFRVVPEIPSTFQIGFLQPGSVYDNVIIRFSNASSAVNADDAKPDLRGVA